MQYFQLNMKENKFILMGLDDSRSKDIAEVLGNKTCKKIIEHLAETREASEKDISDALGIPINTVEYNLNKLVKTGLVERSKNFFWSRKGRKINMFKLAKKHIVISPKPKRVDMKELRTILPVILIAVVLIALIALAIFPQGNKSIGNKASFVSSDSKLKQFNSYDEMKSFLNQTTSRQSDGYALESNALTAPSAAGAGAAKSSTSSADSASSYSHTNIQAEGVDEADIVKNDGKYIYTLSGNKVVIVQAFPATEMKKLSEINLTSARNIFLNGDKLIVFEDSYSYTLYEYDSKARCLGYRCGGYSQTRTNVYVYDITNREKPILSKNYSFPGNYQEARMIGDYIYVVSSKYGYNDYYPVPLYSVNGMEKSIPISDVYYSPYADNDYVFDSVSAISLEGGEVNSKVYIVGGTGQIYVSLNNIYLSYQKTLDWEDYNTRMIKEVYLQIAPESLKGKINEILYSNVYYYDKLSQVSNLIYKYSMSLSGAEKENFDSNIQKSLDEFEIKLAKERDMSAVHRINVDKMDINYASVGEFSGHVLNQFSMDEYKGNLRVATTTGDNWQMESSNNVYVLDKELKIIGKLEDLAHGEKIYSARFMGGRAYLVTFKSVDPLFVIDLSNAENPRVLGYLKIPGYSDYLHPFDENHVIGIGKDANESIDADKVHSSDAVYYTAILGLKVSLFDVTDVEHPTEISKVIIGERGTDSAALSDHKAFLFDKDKGVIVLPVTETKIVNTSYGVQTYEQPETVFQGAYVLNIDFANGISLRGKVTHFDNTYEVKYGYAKDDAVGTNRTDESGVTWIKVSNNNYGVWMGPAYYSSIRTNDDVDKFVGGINYKPNFYDYRYQIQRSLFMDNVLYTVSQSNIKANDLNSLDEINKVDLGYEDYYSGGEILY